MSRTWYDDKMIIVQKKWCCNSSL